MNTLQIITNEICGKISRLSLHLWFPQDGSASESPEKSEKQSKKILLIIAFNPFTFKVIIDHVCFYCHSLNCFGFHFVGLFSSLSLLFPSLLSPA